MSTIAQITANRQNAQSSTGPITEEGKNRSARNAVTLGLFTMNDFVLPEEFPEHDRFCAAFWKDLRPTGPVEETFATEMIRAAWRLRRCGLIESQLALTLEQNEADARTQSAVDRARAQANNIFRRAHKDLRRLQSERLAVYGFVSSTTSQSESPAPTETPAANQSQFIPRGAPCPCGSGEKFKRCCGRNEPGVIHQVASR